MSSWTWLALIGGGIVLVAITGPWFFEIFHNRHEDKPDESGATEAWASGELSLIVKEISVDRELGNTREVDMVELRTRLELEDVEIAVKKRSESVLGNIIHILTNDEAWAKQLAEAQSRKK